MTMPVGRCAIHLKERLKNERLERRVRSTDFLSTTHSDLMYFPQPCQGLRRIVSRYLNWELSEVEAEKSMLRRAEVAVVAHNSLGDARRLIAICRYPSRSCFFHAHRLGALQVPYCITHSVRGRRSTPGHAQWLTRVGGGRILNMAGRTRCRIVAFLC
jgi:hypothetical protein